MILHYSTEEWCYFSSFSSPSFMSFREAFKFLSYKFCTFLVKCINYYGYILFLLVMQMRSSLLLFPLGVIA